MGRHAEDGCRRASASLRLIIPPERGIFYIHWRGDQDDMRDLYVVRSPAFWHD